MSDYDALSDNETGAILATAETVNVTGSEISRAIRNLDTTIKQANAAARGIKVASMWLSAAVAFLTVVQIVAQFD